MLKDIRNFLPLSEKLLTSGMPTAEQLVDASKAGVQVVINLAPFDPCRDLADEGQVVNSLSMEYINIPVDWEHPTGRNLEDFADALDAHQEQKVLVHCQANYRATGFVALYRILRQGWQRERAFADARRIWNPDDYPVWSQFIEDSLSRAPGARS